MDTAVEIRPLVWTDGFLRLLDQTRLPHEESWLECRTVADVADAIRRLAVRGAPAIGIAAAYGMAIAARTGQPLPEAARALITTRPTAANLRWAVERVLRAASSGDDVLAEAHAIAREDEVACRTMGEFGASLVPDGASVLTHCNTGMLCTGGIGTAQGVIWTAHAQGKRVHVWVDETRPVLQGARLTAWELQRLGVPMTLIADGAAASMMARGLVDLVITGADRIAANGDVANKVGTYGLAVAAAHHGVPFSVAAPISTIDLVTGTGDEIEIEERDCDEVRCAAGAPVAPADVPVSNPAFDVTPSGLVTAIVTERGVVRAPYPERLRALVGAAA